MKTCTKCLRSLPLGEFTKVWKDREALQPSCKACNRAYQREWNRRNKDRRNARLRARYKVQSAAMREPSRRYRQKLRRAVLEAYGGICTCCGETHHEFLTIDHPNNDGAAHRKTLKGLSIYKWLKDENYPDGFRVLCWNCNCSRGNYGYCPHELP